ncbi:MULTISPECIES: aspartate kinase [unclassified Moritella]|uniref:aspartate kinase n=1 Tax=unclassified Moritella TaxID=2637987 RepID=UPI001BA598F6|nr:MULTISPECIES: aspartate kinase [unclassified Moritella]QUM86636.1 aspartate kinase [Moritella sp. 28]QUM90864.1 aspartate kinase [Moritella sp. 36]
MALYVQKYGGTSVGSIERIEAVAQRVKKSREQGNQIVVVVSAMSGETNRLLGMAKALDENADRREMDVLVSTGEQVTIALLTIALHKAGVDAISMTGDQVQMKTDNSHGKARIKTVETDNLQRHLDEGKVVVVAGFQGRDEDNNITTLGRGGSDTTAVAIAAVLKADECQIYTDVNGVYTTDPRVEPRARKLDCITFEEMLEMASLGAKVLQIRSVEFAGKYNVPLRVLSSFEEGEGTLITYEDVKKMESAIISGIAFNRDEASLTISGIPDEPLVAANILTPIGDAGIDVDVIVQNAHGEDGLVDFTFTVHRDDYQAARALLEKTCEELSGKDVQGNDRIAKISIVGVGMWNHPGVAKTMFEVLGSEGINMQLISTSEIKISVIVDEKYLELGVRALHAAFNLDVA